ncbi:DMT family transporter [Brevibacillus choshinensis]|uniref:DMT family transporter n=1 Tax=Brevibacillus choshinensis TaxID=54911 RepID=A0ABX7FL26_BRECH|nr:DMT family transporter [Brevibacillus choshinensis]QRG66399.1 DMT family transporter [Brevibacillus choshinensis]
MSPKKQAIAAAVTNAIIVGLSFIFVKLALSVSDPLDTLAHRFTIAFVAAAIPVLFGWVRLTIKPKQMIMLLPLALLYPTLFFALQTFGLVYTTSSEAGIIQATVPIFTLLMATFFLKETTTWLQKASTFLSVAGVIYIFVMKGASLGGGNALGTILILLSALSIAGYSVLAKKMTRSFHYIDITYMVSVVGFLFFNVWAVTRHAAEGTLNQFFTPFQSPIFVLSVLFLGVLSSLVTSFLNNFALSKMEASKLSVFNNLSTLVTVAAGTVFLQEQLALYHVMGAVLIIAGVIGTNYLGAKTLKRKVKSTSESI